jgi:hypothetical protein
MYTLTVQPYYDNNSQNYINIICINMIPEGPLRILTRRLNRNSLSPFNKYDYNYENANNSCIFALKYFNGIRLMTPNDIPDLFSYLVCNGYKIDTNITKMMNTSVYNQNILCFFSYIQDYKT